MQTYQGRGDIKSFRVICQKRHVYGGRQTVRANIRCPWSPFPGEYFNTAPRTLRNHFIFIRGPGGPEGLPRDLPFRARDATTHKVAESYPHTPKVRIILLTDCGFRSGISITHRLNTFKIIEFQ